MSKKMEIETLERECLTKTGAPRKGCDHEKLVRLLELKSQEAVLLPVITKAPDDVKGLERKYRKLVDSIYVEDPEGRINAVMNGKPVTLSMKKGVTAKMMSDFLRLRDKVRQPEPKPERVSLAKTPQGGIKVTVTKGPPVELEGKDQYGVWQIVAVIMPMGGTVTVPGDRYSEFRIVRGSDKPQYVAPPDSNPAPNRKIEKKKKVIEI